MHIMHVSRELFAIKLDYLTLPPLSIQLLFKKELTPSGSKFFALRVSSILEAILRICFLFKFLDVRIKHFVPAAKLVSTETIQLQTSTVISFAA